MDENEALKEVIELLNSKVDNDKLQELEEEITNLTE